MSQATRLDRTLLRLAVRLAARLRADPTDSPVHTTLRDIAFRQELLAGRVRLWRLAQSRGWPRAAAELRGELDSDLGRLAHFVQRAREQLDSAGPASPPSPAEIAADLAQLAEEFDDVEIDLKAGTVSAVVGPITLMDVALGRFRLVLHTRRLDGGGDADASCFDIVALDPNPAAGNDSVTHPHVRDRRLCPGEAERPLRSALRAGRLFDAFALVRSVLSTYAADSPHVPLEDWSSAGCSDCGGSVSRDELSTCDACGSDLCNECSRFCRSCEDTRCSDCLEECAVCSEPTCRRCRRAAGEGGRLCCRGCRKECGGCGRAVPADELDADLELCPDCRERLDAEEPEEVESVGRTEAEVDAPTDVSESKANPNHPSQPIPAPPERKENDDAPSPQGPPATVGALEGDSGRARDDGYPLAVEASHVPTSAAA